MKVFTKFKVDMTIRCLVIALFLLMRYMTMWLWPFDLGQWSYMAGHEVNPSTKFENHTAILLELWVLTSPVGYHWQCICSHYACAAISRDLCLEGKFFPHIWNPWPWFASSLYNFYGATIKTDEVIHQNCVVPCVKDHMAVCACAKSRQSCMLPQIFYHHRSRRPRFSVDHCKFWQFGRI